MSRCDDCKANKVCDHNRFGFENCGNFIPADVAPRAEVARLIDDFQRSIRSDAKIGMSAGEILLHINNMLAELKKKYTERCTDCKHFVGCECFSGKSCDLFES